MKVSYENISFLLTGDIEKGREESLINSKANIDIDVLKIPHHGSKTSSTREFLIETSPKLAIISAGYRNRYHHPHSSITMRIKRLKIPILVTASHGSIQVETDGQSLKIRCFGIDRRGWERCN